MKILVTGATGKVGRRLARRLAQRGAEVRALVREPARAAELREPHRRTTAESYAKREAVAGAQQKRALAVLSIGGRLAS